MTDLNGPYTLIPQPPPFFSHVSQSTIFQSYLLRGMTKKRCYIEYNLENFLYSRFFSHTSQEV